MNLAPVTIWLPPCFRRVSHLSHRVAAVMSRLARPLLIVAKKSGAEVSKDSMLKFYEGKVACRFLPLRARAAL
jgi:hypothetical protein